jgi:hypothetical protein
VTRRLQHACADHHQNILSPQSATAHRPQRHVSAARRDASAIEGADDLHRE